MTKYRILSLDGGGIRGVISATFLKEIAKIVQQETGKKLHEYFDLIAGTSTGSIIAAAIACQMEPEQILDIYKKDGENIFLENIRFLRKWRLLSRFLGSSLLYPHKKGVDKGLANVLKKHLKLEGISPKIGDIEKPLILILAYDTSKKNTTWFTNDKEAWYGDNDLSDICTASASAPTYFPPYQLKDKSGKRCHSYIDGGVSSNNPSLETIAHALWMKNMHKRHERSEPYELLSIDDIAMLSIGTGKTTKSYEYKEVKKWGVFDWGRHLQDIFLKSSDANARSICNQIFASKGMSEKYLRLDFDLNKDKDQKISEAIDDASLCEELENLTQKFIKEGEIFYGYDEKKAENKKYPVSKAIKMFITNSNNDTPDSV